MADSDLTVGSAVQALTGVTRSKPVVGPAERQNAAEGGNALPQAAAATVTRDAVEEAVGNISAYVQNITRELEFQIDDEVGS